MYDEGTDKRIQARMMPSQNIIDKDLTYNEALDACSQAVLSGDLEQSLDAMRTLALTGRDHKVDTLRSELTHMLYEQGIGRVVVAAREAFEQGDIKTARKYTDAAASVQQVTRIDRYVGSIGLLQTACKHLENK